jgi:hypothetical protein
VNLAESVSFAAPGGTALDMTSSRRIRTGSTMAVR